VVIRLSSACRRMCCPTARRWDTSRIPLSTGAAVAGGAEFGLVGEKYGWLVEIDPDDANFRPRKHTALGRFRHENITLRVEEAKPLAYLGDDRRGGHTYKFVSKELAAHRRSKSNSRLLEEGTLYVARYNPDGSGRWLPLMPTTPTNPSRRISERPIKDFTRSATGASEISWNGTRAIR
jgi:secreted PhoX family phosphatase